jgi:hypothetical protein
MSEQWPVVLVASIAFGGFLSGLVGERYPRAPMVAVAGTVLAYVGFLIFLGAWASQCWDCGYETPRYGVMLFAGVFTFPIMLMVLVAVGLGTLAPGVWRRLLDRTHRG